MDKGREMSERPSAREAILAAFRDIILENGYDGVRVLDIVQRSGVARSAADVGSARNTGAGHRKNVADAAAGAQLAVIASWLDERGARPAAAVAAALREITSLLH